MRTLGTIPDRFDASASVTSPARRSAGLARLAFGGGRRLRYGFSIVGRGVIRRDPVDTSDFGERWLTKREIAAYLRVTERFIELQQQVGLPVFRMGAVNRYRVSEVEAWSRREYIERNSRGEGDGI
jgi:hypothetical protein